MKYILAFFYNLWKIYLILIFTLTLVLFYPFLFIVLQSEKLKPISFKINIAWSFLFRILCFYPAKVEGLKNISDTPFILVANHTSYLDIFVLYSLLPQHRFLFMGKSELLKYPFVKTFFKKLNIPVDRSSSVKSAKSMIKAKNALKEGWSIVIFPEGGILDPSPKMSPFKNGAFQLAKLANCPILPISFKNNYKLFSDPSYFFAPAMPGIVKVYIHEMISKKEVDESGIEELKEKTFRIIQRKLPH